VRVEFAVPLVLVLWMAAIFEATSTLGTWAGLAVWLGAPALGMLGLLAWDRLEDRRDSRAGAVERHPAGRDI